MAGIYGVISKNKINIKCVYSFFYSSNLQNIINEEFVYKNFIYGRSVVNKFLNDRILCEDDDIIVGFEGIFYNKETKNTFDTIKQWYIDKDINFINKIKGQFCGFIYDKKIDKLYIFNDHLSTKPLYIFSNDNIFIFASELKVVTKLLAQLNIKKELNYDAIYCMLTFGYMLNEITYEKNIKKLEYASILIIDQSLQIKSTRYFKFNKKENFDLSKNEIIKKIDDLIIKSVSNAWRKDIEYNYRHYSSLSGGLDSRVNLFLAKELGYNDIMTLTFAQSGSSDDVIANNIASLENFRHIFYSLDGGKFLEENLEKYISANDGLVILVGSASGYDFLSKINHVYFGAYHSGQIGDLLFGSYVKKNFECQNAIMSDRKELLGRISFFNNFGKIYHNNAEIFGYEQRVINGTLNGDRTLSHFTDVLSPFYDKDLIEFCLTIPDKYKKDEAIYLDWFNSMHPNISSYIWESSGVKPKNIFIVKIAKIVKRYKNAILRRVGFNINDMNPFDIWLRNNPNITQNLDNVYKKLISNIDDVKLKGLLENMYQVDIRHSHYGRNNKFLVVTFLLAHNLHFGKVD